MRKAPDSKPSRILRHMKELDRKCKHRQKITEKQKKSRARMEERAKHISWLEGQLILSEEKISRVQNIKSEMEKLLLLGPGAREEALKGAVKRYGYGKTNIGKVISDCTEELRLLSKRRKDLTQWLKKSRKKKK